MITTRPLLCKNYPELWYAKADAAQSREMARALFITRWREFDRRTSEAWFDLGETLLEYGYFKESLKAFNKCIELQPKMRGSVLQQAKVLFLMRKTFDALES